MFRQSWGMSNCAKREINLRREKVECAVNTSSHAWINNPTISFESFGSSVYHGFDRAPVKFSVIIVLQQRNKHSIYPSTSNNRIKTANNQMELSIKVFILVLNFAVMRSYFRSRNSFIDELCCNFSLKP